jgi:DNA-binding transcriptional LysR family regulator
MTYALLPAVASALRAHLPEVELELHGELLTPAQVEGLLDRSLDLGLLRPPVRARELQVEIIRSEPLIAAVPAQHRLAGAAAIDICDLAGEPFITYAAHLRSVLGDAIVGVCADYGFTPRSVMEITETATLVSFVAAGIGVALVPASVTGMTVAGATYRPLEQDARVHIAIAWHRDNDSPVLQRALEPVLSAVMAQPSDRLISETSRL